jgi:tetratricopeptide (TPR) repeat protein
MPELSYEENLWGHQNWPHTGYHLQHYGATFIQVESYLYLGDYERAREELLRDWGPMSKSFILRWRILTIMALFLRGRVALACWLQNPSDDVLRREVEDYAKRLKRIPSDWCEPMSRVLLAGLAAGEGRHAEAVRTLNEAYEGFEKLSLQAYASAARYYCGLLRQDELGRAQMGEAIAFMQSQDVRNPTAFSQMLLPGKWI